MKTKPNGFAGYIVVFLLALMITVGLGELYATVIGSLRVAPWVGVVASHAIISLCLYAISSHLRQALQFRGAGYIPWMPAIFVILGAFFLSFATKQHGPAYAVTGSDELFYVLATMTVIPIFEEIVFRAGVTPALNRFVGSFWSIWFSAIVFSAAHSQPTWSRLVGLKVGFLLGPFLLGICCDIIVRRWGRLWPAIAFHSACNASVYIFSTFNPSWLSRLSGLYM